MFRNSVIRIYLLLEPHVEMNKISPQQSLHIVLYYNNIYLLELRPYHSHKIQCKLLNNMVYNLILIYEISKFKQMNHCLSHLICNAKIKVDNSNI